MHGKNPLQRKDKYDRVGKLRDIDGDSTTMKVLITGGAGFIGAHTAQRLVDRGDEVVLVDNFNDYYDPQLKWDRLEALLKGRAYHLYEGDIRDASFVADVFQKERPEKVVHLAAMAGVRNSLLKPVLYAEVNVVGSVLLLEAAKEVGVKNFVFASSSSVYGANTKVPFAEEDRTDAPISPYAATKKADELLAHTWSYLYDMDITALRYFTVYGPWGRPDMALFLFTKSIFEGKEIVLYNNGKMSRNFTYIDDIVSGTLTVLDRPEGYGFDVMNIGGDREEPLERFVEILEEAAGKKAQKKHAPLPPGDVVSTVADITKLRALGWEPKTRIEEGIPKFVQWYREYYQVK